MNLTWSSLKDICTIERATIRFREIKSQGSEEYWSKLPVTMSNPANNYHTVKLDCDKEYEIAVSSWFGQIQSDWSTSWQFKTKSGVALPFISYNITRINDQ